MDRLRLSRGFRWSEVLLFVAVAIVTAASVAYAGLHLRQPAQTTDAPGATGTSSRAHLPNVLEGLCLSRSGARS